jgi:hypothetical protein
MSTETLVRTRAYEIWEAEGRPLGRDAEHWFRALEEVAGSPAMTTPEPKAPLKRAAKKAAAGETTASKAPSKRGKK